MATKYQIWTLRSFLTWLLVCWIPFATAVGLLLVKGPGWPAWGMAGLLTLAVAYITFRRHEQGQQIRDGITEYLSRGTRLVVQTSKPLGRQQILAIDAGLGVARLRCLGYFDALEVRKQKIAAAHDTVFVLVQDEVRSHWLPKGKKVAGLTYPDGTMVLEATGDLHRLESLACHEGVHAILFRLNIEHDCQDATNSLHRLFAPVARDELNA